MHSRERIVSSINGVVTLDSHVQKNENGPITRTEIETVIKNLQQTTAQDQTASQENSAKHLETS